MAIAAGAGVLFGAGDAGAWGNGPGTASKASIGKDTGITFTYTNELRQQILCSSSVYPAQKLDEVKQAARLVWTVYQTDPADEAEWDRVTTAADAAVERLGAPVTATGPTSVAAKGKETVSAPVAGTLAARYAGLSVCLKWGEDTEPLDDPDDGPVVPERLVESADLVVHDIGGPGGDDGGVAVGKSGGSLDTGSLGTGSLEGVLPF